MTRFSALQETQHSPLYYCFFLDYLLTVFDRKIKEKENVILWT